MYLTYAEYQNMGGTLSETAFNDAEFEARSIIDWYTFCRLQKEETQSENVKRCVYTLIKNITDMNNVIQGSISTDNAVKSIASQSNDGVSVSYNTLAQKDVLDYVNVNQTNIIRKYLNGVKNSFGQLVLYRGVYPNE